MKRKLLVLTVIALMFTAVAAAEHGEIHDEPEIPPCDLLGYVGDVGAESHEDTVDPEGDHPFYNYDFEQGFSSQNIMSYVSDCGTNASYINNQDKETLENAQQYADQNDATGSSYSDSDFAHDLNALGDKIKKKASANVGGLIGHNDAEASGFIQSLFDIFATNDRVEQLEERVKQLEGQKNVLRVQVEEHHGEPDVSLLAEVAADNNLTELTYGDRTCEVYKSHDGMKFRCVR